MFTLMLFFLLCARVRGSEGLIPANLPNTEGHRDDKTDIIRPVRILLRPAGQDNLGVLYEVNVSGRLLMLNNSNDLYNELARMKASFSNTEVPLAITPVSTVRWGHVVNAFNQAVRAKFTKVGFAPAPG